MKTKTKKIAQYSAIALAAAAILPMACKKETKVADDPEIDVSTLNLTFSYNGAIDTHVDTSFITLANELYIGLDNDIYRKYVYLDFNGDSRFQKNVSTSVNGEDWDFLPILTEGATIDTNRAAWITGASSANDDGYLFVNDKDPLPGASAGIAGQGDKFIAFRNGTGSSFKYGWMKVNVAANANSITIKEVAMSNIFNKVIKVGAK